MKEVYSCLQVMWMLSTAGNVRLAMKQDVCWAPLLGRSKLPLSLPMRGLRRRAIQSGGAVIERSTHFFRLDGGIASLKSAINIYMVK